MPSQWIFYSYMLAVGAAVLLLLLFRSRRWYWHALSFLLGLVAGLIPPPSGYGGDVFYLLAGTACLFFTVLGLGGLFFRRSSG